MQRIVAIAAVASIMLIVAAPPARRAIESLRSEFASLDALAVPAPIARPQQTRWVRVGDYTAALARELARRRLK